MVVGVVVAVTWPGRLIGLTAQALCVPMNRFPPLVLHEDVPVQSLHRREPSSKSEGTLRNPIGKGLLTNTAFECPPPLLNHRPLRLHSRIESC